ncbi:MAG: ribonuclease J [Actinobacteria bacterium]|nr:ribonuclease J [Actinomycetota bacterium]
MSTGSQGEPLSALRKMALNEHPRVKIIRGDMVIISASPIPGNENAISSTINMLLKQGANVFYESIAGVHVSGHAQQEEIKMLINLVKPKYFIPVHGELKHRVQNARLAKNIGMRDENIIMAQNGDIVKMNENMCRISDNINLQNIYIDGYGTGNTEDIVLKDRKVLARNGVVFITFSINSVQRVVLTEPEFILKGIIYIEQFEDFIKGSRKLIVETVKRCFNENMINASMLEDSAKEALEKSIIKKVQSRPVIVCKIIDLANIL